MSTDLGWSLYMVFWLVLLLIFMVVGCKYYQRGKLKTYLFERYLDWRTEWHRVDKISLPTIHPSYVIAKMFPWSIDAYDSLPEYASTQFGDKTVWLVNERHLDKKRSVLYSDEYFLKRRYFTATLFVYTHFQQKLPGVVRIGPQRYKPGNFSPDFELESREFNKDVYLYAQPERLASAVLPPDFMEWYQALKQKPWISLESNACVVMIPQDADLAIVDQYVQHALEIIKRIEHSGALEKKP